MCQPYCCVNLLGIGAGQKGKVAAFQTTLLYQRSVVLQQGDTGTEKSLQSDCKFFLSCYGIHIFSERQPYFYLIFPNKPTSVAVNELFFLLSADDTDFRRLMLIGMTKHLRQSV